MNSNSSSSNDFPWLSVPSKDAHLKDIKGMCILCPQEVTVTVCVYLNFSSVPFMEDKGEVLVTLANEIQIKSSTVNKILLDVFYISHRIPNL